jgi:mono/diheme cytochrome c family protein
MRHVVVTRAVLLLAAGLGGACLLFARCAGATAGGAGGPEAAGVAGAADAAEAATTATAGDGARLFDARCGACHDAADLATELRSSPDPASARVELLRFLAGHGHSRAEECLVLAEWLATGPER